MDRDDDEHVLVRERFEDSLRVMLVLRFFEDALARCDQAKRDIEAAQHRLIDAQDYWMRTRETLMQAVKIQAMRRR